MSERRRLEGKAIALTGAGRGIGREIALLCASHGASVVVNDLGGADQRPAEEVVSLIRGAGGGAVANGSNVADPAGANSMPAELPHASEY